MRSASLAGYEIDLEALEALPAAEREIAAEHLRRLEEEHRRNPLHGYSPHGKQVSFHSLPSPRTRLFLGGNRSGKTTATHVDTIIQCLDASAVPEHLRRFKRWEPPFYCRIVGPDLTRWLEGVALQKFREWCPRDQLQGGGFQHGWDKQQVMLRFKNGSSVQFMSNDQDLDKFAGAALHRVVFDESPRYDIRRECRYRLIDYGGEEVFGLTPVDGMSNWLYEEFYEPWESGELPDGLARLVLVDMDDNPHLSDEDKEWALAGSSSEEREARKTGRFVSFSGLIYPGFFPDRHVIPDLEPGKLPEAEFFEAVDPGMRHMAAVVFCYLDEEDRLVVYDELAVQGKTVREVAKQIQLKRAEWGVTPRWTVMDPAARNKNPQTGRSDQQEYQDNGIRTILGQNEVRAGINRVSERIEADKLLVSARCSELRREFKMYRWKKDSNRTEDDATERPVKKDDHLLDALRYVCMQRPMTPVRERRKPTQSMRDWWLEKALSRLSRPQTVTHPSGDGMFS